MLLISLLTIVMAAALLVAAARVFALRRGRVGATAAVLIALPALPLFGSIAVPFLAFFAACLSAIAAIGAFVYSSIARIVIVRALSVGVVAGAVVLTLLQPLGLKVMNLPKADALPYEPVPFHVVKTYDEGVWFESVRVGPDGTIYLAANIGLDFEHGSYYRHAHGEVIARRLDGTERTILTTPEGDLSGCFAIANDGTIYMASNGIHPAIWRITRDGHGERFAPLPNGAWPNGLAFGPNGKLYSSDSSLARIWEIDPHTGSARIAIDDTALGARPFVSLAPGANGLQFRGNELIVTVSDSTKVLGYQLQPDGSFKTARELARGIPGDDFAVGHDGSLFITTHPYNTIVRVAPDGRRSIVGDARQHIVGATDAQFGRTPADRDTLYVATDGGAFTGGPRTRGELVALFPYASTAAR